MRDHRRPLRQDELGVVWWLVVIIVVAVVAIVAIAAGVYVATRPTAPAPEKIACPAGEFKVHVEGMAGAQPGQNYTVQITAKRRCDLGQANCTCGSTSGTFGTPTTPCDTYDGNVDDYSSTDMVPPGPGVYTAFDKTVSNLREGVYEVTVIVSTPGQQAVSRTCCVIVKSGQVSELKFGCGRVLLPGASCPDCTTSGSPGNPTGPASNTTGS